MSQQPSPVTAYPSATFLDSPDAEVEDRAFSLIWEALLYNEEAYWTLRNHVRPIRRGALVLLIIVALVALAQAAGLALGVLTTPRIDILQNSIYDFITQTGLFTRRVAASPEFAQEFKQIYEGVWQSIRLFGGFPSWSGTLAAASVAVLGTFLNWLIFGLLAHWTALWFGGEASLKQFLGPLALAYAPLLLTVVLLVPGATIAMPLVFLALLAAKYQAIKTTYGLSPFGGLAVTLIPYLLTALLLLAVVLFGAAYGVGRIPYLEPIISALRIVRLF